MPGATDKVRKQEVNILHIGLGNRGHRWVSAVQKHPGARSVGCVDSASSTLSWVRTRFPGLTLSQDIEEVLPKVHADGAIIAGSPGLRAAHAIQALEAGLTVMVEEPFATSLADAVAVLNVSRRTGKSLIVMSHEAVTRGDASLQPLIAGGKVGTVTHVSCADRRVVSSSEPESCPYCQLLTVGIHQLEMLRHVLGVDPISLIARCSRSPCSPYEHGSTSEVFVEMGRNIHLQYYGSLTSNRNEVTLWIEGDKGVLKADGSRIWWRRRGWRFFAPLSFRKSPGPEQSWPFTMWVDQLGAAINGAQVPKTGERNSLWPVSMVEAIRRSDETGKVIQIPQLLAAAEASIGFSTPGFKSVVS
jgi:predicted dehydrogenase